ncbi:nitrilase-related carbon-nitrogen hydrolase [Desulfococcaceae bacterium HSG9]|nr:nitrilase-related carbon-nitrogen hydrolase [Desulfococcaceae bacterium HSG9]
MRDIRIATVIFNAPAGEKSLNLDRIKLWVRAAHEHKAEIICFPEMNITGYGVCPSVITVAELIPGPITRTLEQLAVSEQIIILAGMAEKDSQGRLFVTHLIVRPNRPVGVYRKLHLAPPEQSVFTQGNTVAVFKIQDFCFGVQLCYDAHFPELTTQMALRGADAIFIPHASPRGTPDQKMESWMRHLTARAFDNALFIIVCNQSGENGAGLTFPGIAMVIDPSGHIINKDICGKEGLLVTELKAEALNYVRNHRMRFFLPHRRSELYDR